MKNTIFLLVAFILSCIFSSDLFSQDNPVEWFNCKEIPNMPNIKNSISPGGLYKPERTDSYPFTNDNSVFRILVVFVQFNNDYTHTNSTDWPPQSSPSYFNSLLALERSTNYGQPWWNAYNESTETISDYFMEQSLGHFHVVGKCINIILSYDSSHYQYQGGLNELNSEIYDKLYQSNLVDWPSLDKWRYNNDTFEYIGDTRVDMIYVVHRVWRDNIKEGAPSYQQLTNGSIASLYNSTQGSEYILPNNYKIIAGIGVYGTGITFTPGYTQKNPQAPFSKNRFLLVQAHELGHYFGFYHPNYGLMMGYTSYAISMGVDSKFSLWETIAIGYGTPREAEFNNTNRLYDFSSRNNTNTLQVIKVPLSNNTNEYFLLSYRNKVSSYDRIMIGDTARGNGFANINENYGKGLYIYHINSGFEISNMEYQIDLECADGLFDWEISGVFNPDWSYTQLLPKYTKLRVNREGNDASLGRLLGADDKSVYDAYYSSPEHKYNGIGKIESQKGYAGTDKIYTNDRSNFTSFACLGDRWDAWRMNYNSLFSPYSNPSTDNWGHQKSYIYIQIIGQTEDYIDLAIYKPDEKISEEEILYITPPSKPAGVIIEEYYPQDSSICHPMIKWNHNIETDMNNDNSFKYIIYRAQGSDMTKIPGNYTQLAELTFSENEFPYFIDFTVNEYDCSNYDFPPYGTPYPIRYAVKAIDKDNLYSDLSDFVGTEGISNNGSKEPPPNSSFKIKDNKNILFLGQNYPNPFNPITRINYSLPFSSDTKIAIYDLTGKEINVLVNAFKKAGEYVIEFNASFLSSGIYFYRMITSANIITKKMVIIK